MVREDQMGFRKGEFSNIGKLNIQLQLDNRSELTVLCNQGI